MPDTTLLNGVNLLPASGEWVYDTVPHRTREVTQAAPVVANLNAAPGGPRRPASRVIRLNSRPTPAAISSTGTGFRRTASSALS